MLEDEFKSRLKKIQAYLDEKEFDGILAYSMPWRKDHVRYIANYRTWGGHSYALLSKMGKLTLFITIPDDVERAEEESWASKVIPLSSAPWQELIAEIKDLGIKKRLGVAGLEFCPAKTIAAIQEQFPHLEIISSSNALINIRAVKSDYEIGMMRKAARICDLGFQTFLEHAHQGIKEYELVAEVERRVRHEGAEDHFMIIASGGKDTMCMTPPRDKELRLGELVLTEVTPQYHGYWTQICRSVAIGDISKEMQQSHDIFFRATEEALKIAKPGVPITKLAEIQNQVFREEGFGEYTSLHWTRSRGHGQGLHLDEPPLIAEGNEMVLQEGMVIIVHPNTYLPLAGYMVFGDPTLITSDGLEILTKTERKLFCQSS
jgi:Xaa-Pro aminopeptidase